MSDNPRENVTDKGFWEGGASGHDTNKESSGRPSGYPGRRAHTKTGSRTDLEFPRDIDNEPPTE